MLQMFCFRTDAVHIATGFNRIRGLIDNGMFKKVLEKV
jgi:hypothetical protein